MDQCARANKPSYSMYRSAFFSCPFLGSLQFDGPLEIRSVGPNESNTHQERVLGKAIASNPRWRLCERLYVVVAPWGFEPLWRQEGPAWRLAQGRSSAAACNRRARSGQLRAQVGRPPIRRSSYHQPGWSGVRYEPGSHILDHAGTDCRERGMGI